MAAIHQRSTSNIETSADLSEASNVNFIESMEEEVRRCAEHLERRQSYRAYRSKERKANGFAAGPGLSSAAFHSSAEVGLGSRNSTYRSTLPRSFWSDAADQEDRSVLSPRIIAPGRRSPHKSPDKNSGNRVFRFSNGYEEAYSSGHFHSHLQHEDLVSPGPCVGGYTRGNSAPPETYTCYNGGGGSSRESHSTHISLSPQGRTPIGAVASHSRQSSSSGSSPPPVPPKPGRGRPRLAKSHTPPPPPRSPHHTITVNSYSIKPTLKPTPMDLYKSPVDPLSPSELAKAVNAESPPKELEFPSAEIDPPTFSDKKSISISVLSSVATESSSWGRDEVRESSAPPFVSSSTHDNVSKAGACQIVARLPVSAAVSRSNSSGAITEDPSSLSSPEVKQVSLHYNSNRRRELKLRKRNSGETKSTRGLPGNAEDNGQCGPSDAREEVIVNSESESPDERLASSPPNNKVEEEEVTVKKENGCLNTIEVEASEVDGSANEAKEETSQPSISVDDNSETETQKSENSSTVSKTVSKTADQIKTSKSLEELKKEGDKILAESEETSELLSPAASSESGIADKDGANSDISADVSPLQTRLPVMPSGGRSNLSTSRSPSSSPSPSPRHVMQESPKIMQASKTNNRRGSFEIEEVFLPIVPSLKRKDVVVTDAEEPEIKSIPIRSYNSRHSRGRSGGSKITPSAEPTIKETGGVQSKPSTVATPTSVDEESRPQPKSDISSGADRLQAVSIDPAVLDGSAEPTQALVAELASHISERDTEIARLQDLKAKELREKDDRIKKLSREARKLDRDKWELLKRAKDGAERSLNLRTQLDSKEGALRSLQGELDRTRDELSSVKSANASLRALLSDLRAERAGVDVGVQVEMQGATLRRNRSIELAYSYGGLSPDQETTTTTVDTSFDRDVNHRMSSTSLNWPDRWAGGERDRDSFLESTSLTDEIREVTPTPSQLMMMTTSSALGTRESRKSRKKSTFLSKMIRTSGRRGSKASVGSMDNLDVATSGLVSNSLTSYQPLPMDLKEQWRILEEAKSVPFSKWDLQAVTAWFEVGLGMGQYSKGVVEKCPSGAALSSLTESDMEKKLAISNPLHRRKLTLALQEKKTPQSCQYPHAGNIDHNWVAYEWAHDCGMAHLTESLAQHLVDGRVLNSLSKDDLKRHLKISKKVDQLSFLSGVELLRMHEFNREAIQQHRRNSHNPLYWTNEDVCEWLQRINLQDYAGNVIGGGIHGALLVLERGRFSSEHLANILQIPGSKGQLRRHLTGKLASLFNDEVTGSMDSLHRRSVGTNSPLNLSPGNPYGASSQSPVPVRRGHSPIKPVTSVPMRDYHPMRRNSLTRRSLQLLSHHSVAPPTGLEQTASNQSNSTGDFGLAPSPQPFNRAALERARMSLRESALRSARDEAPPHNRTVTPTVLSSTTV